MDPHRNTSKKPTPSSQLRGIRRDQSANLTSPLWDWEEVTPFAAMVGSSTSQVSPNTNISLEGNTSRISHSKSGIESLYFLHNSWSLLLSPTLPGFPSSSSAVLNPVANKSNAGTFSRRLNIWPMAYFSSRKRRAHSGDVIRTQEVAVHTTLPAHLR